MAVSRHLGFYRTANSAIRSADPENPSLEPNMEWIGYTFFEICAFKLYCDLETGVRGHSKPSKVALFGYEAGVNYISRSVFTHSKVVILICNVSCQWWVILNCACSLVRVITRKLCYRKDDRAMRPMHGCPENFRDSLTTPTATIPNIFHGLLFGSTSECSCKIWSP